MTGFQFPKTARASSSSPKLKLTSKSPNSNKIVNRSNLKPLLDIQQHTSKGRVTPVKPGKRDHQSISPVNSRTESVSPKAKFRYLSSPTTITNRNISTTPATSSENLTNSVSLNNSFAVPKVSAEPPNPSVLPSPPKHWVGERNGECLAKKQQCKDITRCLVTHLASSGILVSAQ